MDLPVFYIPSPNGLFIDTVDVSMNATTFQCILPAINDNPTQVSCLGVLTVEPCKSNYDNLVSVPPNMIVHNYTFSGQLRPGSTSELSLNMCICSRMKSITWQKLII